jgi:ABC-2 type transport system permease protein
MFRNVFLKTLRDQRRSLVGWSIGVVILVLLEAALWPSVRDMPDLQQFLASYPEAMRKLFNLEEFGTGTGFMNAELFSALLPVLFIIFAVGRGARILAGEEEAGTLDVLLVTPVSAVRLVLQ